MTKRVDLSKIPTMPTKLRQYNVWFSDGTHRMYRAESVDTVRRLATISANRMGIRVVSIA